MTTRRQFVTTLVPAAAMLIGAAKSLQAQPARLEESDPLAGSLGYKHDATKVDAKKYPAHKPAQVCGNCALYQGKPTDAAGACPLFAGKQVASKGWCSAHAPKPA